MRVNWAMNRERHSERYLLSEDRIIYMECKRDGLAAVCPRR